MLDLDASKFEKVVTEAKAKCAGNADCLRAIDRAVEQVESNPDRVCSPDHHRPEW